jgi:outer membrane protein W
MKTTRLIFGLFIMMGVLGFFLYSPAYAQNWYTAVTYQMSTPTGDTQQYIDNPSYLGWGLDFRQTVNNNVAVGFSFGWNVFHETTSESIDVNRGSNQGTVSGFQDRTLNAFPMMVNASYFFGEKGGIRPYVGMNLGGFVFIDTFSVGIWQVEETRGDWGWAPEAGVIIPMDYDFGLLVSLKYNYAFTGESAIGKDINNSYLTMNIGIAFLQ